MWWTHNFVLPSSVQNECGAKTRVSPGLIFSNVFEARISRCHGFPSTCYFPSFDCLWDHSDTAWQGTVQKKAPNVMPVRKSPPSPTSVRRKRYETMSFRRESSVAHWTKWASIVVLICILLFSLSFWELYSEEKAELSTLRSRVAVVYAGMIPIARPS